MLLSVLKWGFSGLKDVPYFIDRSVELFSYWSRTIRQATGLVYKNQGGDSAKSAWVVVRCQFWTGCAPATPSKSHRNDEPLGAHND